MVSRKWELFTRWRWFTPYHSWTGRLLYFGILLKSLRKTSKKRQRFENQFRSCMSMRRLCGWNSNSSVFCPIFQPKRHTSIRQIMICIQQKRYRISWAKKWGENLLFCWTIAFRVIVKCVFVCCVRMCMCLLCMSCNGIDFAQCRNDLSPFRNTCAIRENTRYMRMRNMFKCAILGNAQIG